MMQLAAGGTMAKTEDAAVLEIAQSDKRREALEEHQKKGYFPTQKDLRIEKRIYLHSCLILR
jgi:hypothetical protein